MSDEHQSECYGRMFPGVLELAANRPVSGKVFTVSTHNPGGMFHHDHSVTADMAQWDRCRECPEFDGCYAFSMAKLALESAVHAQ
jgi:hypothetical protein